MRSITVLRMTCRSIAALAMWTTVSALAGGEQPGSLSHAVFSDDAPGWSKIEFASVDGMHDESVTTLSPVPGDGAISFVEQPCSDCGGQGCGHHPYNRCGCNSQLFPWISGPGNCDNWCVGPHWNVEVDGLMIRRESIDWDPIAAAVGLPPSLADQFDYGPGARIFATAYNDSSYGLQIGYEGVNEFNATALFPGAGASRTFDYQSTLNSLEINLIRRTEWPTKIFAGFRYIELDEDLVDATLVDKTIPAPSTPPTSVSFIDNSQSFLLENRLIGFQLGAFRDAWQLNRWITIEPFGNAGLYFNNFKRENLTGATTTTITSDDPATLDVDETQQVVSQNEVGVKREFSELAMVGEAGVTAIVRVNRCVALRSGYQAMVIDGVGQGVDAYFAPGLDPTTVVYHGFRFGIEYQR